MIGYSRIRTLCHEADSVILSHCRFSTNPGSRVTVFSLMNGSNPMRTSGLSSGARPKELAETTAADFDGERLRLSHRKGRPPKLRSRYGALVGDGAAFFSS